MAESVTSAGKQRILDSIGNAQWKSRTEVNFAEHPATSTEYRVTSDQDGDQIALLIDRLEDYRAVVKDVRGTVMSLVELGEFLTDLASELNMGPPIVSPEFPEALRPRNSVVDDGFSPAELDDIGMSMTTCAAAVALTGTILMDHIGAQGRRAITLVPDVHVCLIRADQVFGVLPEAISSLGPRSVMTWISGPSATSDIELQRVEGVHGPRTLIVVIHDIDDI